MAPGEEVAKGLAERPALSHLLELPSAARHRTSTVSWPSRRTTSEQERGRSASIRNRMGGSTRVGPGMDHFPLDEVRSVAVCCLEVFPIGGRR